MKYLDTTTEIIKYDKTLKSYYDYYFFKLRKKYLKFIDKNFYDKINLDILVSSVAEKNIPNSYIYHNLCLYFSIIKILKKRKLEKIFVNRNNKFSLKSNLENLEYVTTSYEVFKERNKSSFDLLNSIQNSNIYRVYPHNLFCNTKISDRCITHNDENIFYIDDDHVSAKGAEMINNLIVDKIKEIELKKSDN